ncbi:aminotransferase class V-fold PLP-dependent enzyme [Roseivirga misakiensis]|uniref:Cysteine desulfurase n=1 Tax=Roseivirga misakiensis TaxID=1563681 RepID=A0A1E5T061_9BACT|nr:cysteine desulfurase [Roseivirga misakiensis]OEK04697.1 hypothetical protein BFP71_14700 [Roseivirga misakiensis]
MVSLDTIKAQFPIFKQVTPHGKRLVYLDNAATCHKPQSVIDRITKFYAQDYGTVGRASYWPAYNTTKQFDQVRHQVKELINAQHAEEIVFTFGTTDGINKLANAYLSPRLEAGDEVIVSEMEHHANILAWQRVCNEKGASIKVIPMKDTGNLDYEAYEALLNDKVRLVAITGISNALGVKNDLKAIVNRAKAKQIPVFIDAAQSLSHDPIDVTDLGCDFLAFSGHKLYGPTGVGALYGKKALLEAMPPMSLGGGIVKEVGFKNSSFQDSPTKHEGGTPNIAGVIGLGAAIDFINEVGYDQIGAHTHDLTNYALEKLSQIEGVQIVGEVTDRASVLSFVMEGVHAHDLSTLLNEKGICIRAGHHCAQPLMKRMKQPATARVSFAIYNTKEDVDVLVAALKEIKTFMS